LGEFSLPVGVLILGLAFVSGSNSSFDLFLPIFFYAQGPVVLGKIGLSVSSFYQRSHVSFFFKVIAPFFFLLS